MITMYVISNETDKIVATISADNGVNEFGESDADGIQDVFMDRFGPNDYTNSYTDFGAEYADNCQEITLA